MAEELQLDDLDTEEEKKTSFFGLVQTGSWMGPPQGKRAPRVGPIIIVWT